MGVFKAYDIRGIYGKEIDNEFSYRVGRAYARISGASAFIIGHDARMHSEELYQRLIEGLVDEGRQVDCAGLTSTPALHFAQVRGKIESGIMVTASHNPPRYHGFKFFDADGGSVSYSKGLDRLEREFFRMAASGTAKGVEETNKASVKQSKGNQSEGKPSAGKSRRVDVLEEYIRFLAGISGEENYPQRIVIDTSNGSSGRVFSLLVNVLGIKAGIINAEPDGSFPNHGPNPLLEGSRQQIIEKVRNTGADLGVLIDGDGDRIIFIDENGTPVESYFTSALIAEELLRAFPSSSIVYDLISSRVLPERIGELGGKPFISRIGYTFLYDEMVRTGAIFGSESSGHVYFKVTDRFYTESAAYALIVLLKLLRRRKRKLSELIAPLKEKYSQAPETNLEVKNKEAVMEKVEKFFSKGEITRLDGLSISFDDYWFNLRQSNTEPLLRLRLEAVDRRTALKRLNEIVVLIRTEESNEN